MSFSWRGDERKLTKFIGIPGTRVLAYYINIIHRVATGYYNNTGKNFVWSLFVVVTFPVRLLVLGKVT